MCLAICQTIAGGGDAIGAVLCLRLCHHPVKVLHHGGTQTACLGEGHAATAASAESAALGVGVGGAGVADCACHGVRCCCEYCSRSEGDRGRGRSVDFGNVSLVGIGGDRFQDRQELGTVSGTVQEGSSEVAGHGRIVVCGLWFERKGGGGSEVRHHLLHLLGIDGGVIPANTVASLDEVASDLSVSHAADELFPRGLPRGTELNTCLCGVVQELIVADPEGGVPSFVVCPTVHGLSFRLN